MQESTNMGDTQAQALEVLIKWYTNSAFLFVDFESHLEPRQWLQVSCRLKKVSTDYLEIEWKGGTWTLYFHDASFSYDTPVKTIPIFERSYNERFISSLEIKLPSASTCTLYEYWIDADVKTDPNESIS
jgi:hypothetical protein